MRELRLLKHKLAMMSIRTLLCILSVASTTYVRSLRQTCIEHDPEGSGAKPCQRGAWKLHAPAEYYPSMSRLPVLSILC